MALIRLTLKSTDTGSHQRFSHGYISELNHSWKIPQRGRWLSQGVGSKQTPRRAFNQIINRFQIGVWEIARNGTVSHNGANAFLKSYLNSYNAEISLSSISNLQRSRKISWNRRDSEIHMWLHPKSFDPIVNSSRHLIRTSIQIYLEPNSFSRHGCMKETP